MARQLSPKEIVSPDAGARTPSVAHDRLYYAGFLQVNRKTAAGEVLKFQACCVCTVIATLAPLFPSICSDTGSRGGSVTRLFISNNSDRRLNI